MRVRGTMPVEESAVSETRKGEFGLTTLAAQLGNRAFGLARAAPVSGVAHPMLNRLQLMRTPLSDAIHAAGTGSQAAAFVFLHGKSLSQMERLLRPLEGADLVTLRQHIADAPAAEQAQILTALGSLLMWSDAEAAAIRTLYVGGAYTTTATGNVRQTHTYALWRARAAALLHGKPAAERTAGNTWLAAHEAHEEWVARGSTGTDPGTPGALPTAFSSIGAPPTPSIRVVHSYSVTLPGTTAAIRYRDDPVAPAYAYLINETGVAHTGQKLSSRSDAAAIFTAAGITDLTVRKVMTKVSTQEGGFEAVNTYDTGYISVGFIQFASGADGTGSLASVLSEMKTSYAADFATYFHNLGIDVDAVGLTVVDPQTGNILRGSAAVRKVMDDKRLTAVFQRAGTDSRSFQAAQVKRAKAQYYLASQSFTVTQATPGAGNITITGHYEDVLTSEAGKQR